MAAEKSWDEIFQLAIAKDATPEMLGDALAAVALFNEVQSEAKAAVQQACLRLIRKGDESRIPEMVDLLSISLGPPSGTLIRWRPRPPLRPTPGSKNPL